MNFKEATDQITGCVTLASIAEEMGVAENTLLRARMDPSNPNSRTAPPGWEEIVAKLARARAGELLALADELERGPRHG